MKDWLAVGIGFLLALVAVAAGCSRTASQATESSNMKPLAIFYGQYLAAHKGQPPADEAQFKEFVKTLRPELLKSLEVADVNSVFVSTRDKKPYVIRYGKVAGPPGPGGVPVVAYEQEGVGGKRFVATTVGAVAEVEDAKFRELVPDAK